MCSMRDGILVFGDWVFEYGDGTFSNHKNMLVQSGLNYLAALLIAEQTNNVPIHLALGTGTTAPASTDSKLVTEGYRKAVSAKTRQGNLVRLRTMLLSSEANSTWREFGIFMAGTDLANSGVLLNRLVPPGGISKTANTVLTVEVRLTFMSG